MVTNNAAKVVDQGDLHKYRTELPNLIDDMELSVYAYRLYGRLKRVAGDNGECWQSTKTLSKACAMSAGMVSRAKKELAEKRLIRIEKRTRPEDGGNDTDLIVIVDIWLENFLKYATRSEGKIDTPPYSPDEQGISQGEKGTPPHEHPTSPHETKKNPIKKEPIKNSARGNDPRAKHPAILLVRGVTGKMPPKSIWDMVIQRLGEHPDGERFAQVNAAWDARGFNPQNIGGKLDWYRDGIPTNGKNVNGKARPVEDDAAKLAQQRKALYG